MVGDTRGSSAQPARAPQSALDFRNWIEKAKAIGQLKEAPNADLKYELGAISELNAKRRGAAILFSNFPGYPEGFRVLTGSMLNAETLGLTLGIDEKLDNMSLTHKVSDMLRAIEASAKD